MKKLTNFVAKKVICAAPISSEQPLLNLQKPFHSYIKRLDSVIQNWALSESDNFSAQDWEKIQYRKLHALLISAQETVPHWYNVFRNAGFDARQFSDFSDLRKLPIISRSDVKKEKIENMIALELFQQRSVEAHTSGSTSEPLKFYQDKRDIFRRRINTSQEFRYALGQYETAVPVVVIGLEPHLDLTDFGNRIQVSELENEIARKEEIYPHITTRRPVLITTASTIRRLEYLLRWDHMQLQFRAIFYRGEHLENSALDKLSKFFKCPIYTTYGSGECSLLGIECSYHRLHTAPWVNYVEILDEQNLPVEVGREGSIVITFLENYVMPFIRYRIGDTGSFSSEICPCGRSTKIINFSGRQQMMLTLPNQIDVPLINLTRYIDEHCSMDILQYQFEDTADGLIFRYIANGNRISSVEEGLRSYFSAQLHNQCKVIVTAVSEILPEPNGKTSLLIRRKSS